MKEATVTLSDELLDAVEAYRRDQGGHADLAAITEAALTTYLRERGYLLDVPPLHIPPAPTGSGKDDVSIHHDQELAGA